MNQQNLNGLTEKLLLCGEVDNQSFRPEVFDFSNKQDKGKLEQLIDGVPNLAVHDRIGEQLKELFKIRNPKNAYSEKDLDELLEEWKGQNDIQSYGVWVYYPWKSLLIHLVDREEFIELRTSRNHYKITPEEQKELQNKIVGVIGLSVGQSVSVTLTIERSFGTIRVADFDTLELTNLNRIRRGLDSLGQKKTTMVAREIAEIDPFLNVEVYDKGINPDNISDFLTRNGKMDLLIEECDSLDIKILSRVEAKKLGIPVLMDTSDRGMIDIERFDLEPKRPIFHGKIALEDPSELKDLGYEEKIPFILDLIGVPEMSYRLKSSMLEVGESITTWPQLASDVTFGGAVTAKIARQILLNEGVVSGRFYTEGEDVWIEKKGKKTRSKTRIDDSKILEILKKIEKPENLVELDPSRERQMLDAASLAFSHNNNQPWRIYKFEHQYFIFQNSEELGEFGNEKGELSAQAIGAFCKNAQHFLRKENLDISISWSPNKEINELVAKLAVTPLKTEIEQFTFDKLIPYVDNYQIVDKVENLAPFLSQLQTIQSKYVGLELENTSIENDLDILSDGASRIHVHRILDKKGHQSYFDKIQWTDEEIKKSGAGVLVEDLLVKSQEKVMLQILKSHKVAKFLGRLNLGKGLGIFKKMAVSSSSALFIMTSKVVNKNTYVNSGMFIQEIGLLAAQFGYSMHNLSYLIPFLQQKDFNDEVLAQKTEIEKIKANFSKIFPSLESNDTVVFIFTIGKGKDPVKQYYRKKLDDIYLHLD